MNLARSGLIGFPVLQLPVLRPQSSDWLAANPNDLSDPPLADPIVQLVVHEFAEPSLLGSS
jgi:hypothetical protein